MRRRGSKELNSPGALFADGSRMRSRCHTAVLACVVVAGCTHGVVSPDQITTGPSALSVVEVMITPVGGGSLTVGASAPIVTSGGLPTNAAALGAFARFNDGSGRYVDAVW